MVVQPEDGRRSRRRETGGGTLRVACLASGSSGNSILIQSGDRALLVDAGLSGRKLLALLGERGLGRGALDGVLVTHEHTDHTSGARIVATRVEAPIVANDATLKALKREGTDAGSRVLGTGATASVGAFEVSSFPISHDAEDPVGYVVEAEGYRIAVATDLGCASMEVVTALSSADLVVVEANHDTQRLIDGRYPWPLKQRIMSETGHLSNRQSAELIAAVLSRRPQTFWLAHLSKQNNTPTLARKGVVGYLAAEGLSPPVLVTARDGPSLVWEPPTTDVQLSLFASAGG